MKLQAKLYEKIMLNYAPAPPERGGIIGMRSDVVCEYAHDRKLNESDCAIYTPDVKFLNTYIENWLENDTVFCGVVHSHIDGQTTLSSGDIEYITKLYQLNPWLTDTFYPLILNGNRMIVYRAKVNCGSIEVVEDSLILI